MAGGAPTALHVETAGRCVVRRAEARVIDQTAVRCCMALVVFLRGINVGGHRRFRPSLLERELGEFDVVNIGAAGTLVVRKPGSRTRFLAALRRRIPFEAEVAVCEGRDLVALVDATPFGDSPAAKDVTRFVSVLSKPGRTPRSLPITLPAEGDWLVRVIGSRKRFVFGEYRRHMKTIGYLGQIDRLFAAPATTRNWNTIRSIVAILADESGARRSSGRGGKRPPSNDGMRS